MRNHLSPVRLSYYCLLHLLLIPVVFVINSCRKHDVDQKLPDAFAAHARQWFSTKVVQVEKDLLFKSKWYIPANSPYRRFARMRKLDKLLDWDLSQSFRVGNSKVVSVPIIEDKSAFTNKQFQGMRNLVIYEDRDGKTRMRIAEMISDKGQVLPDNARDLINRSFINMFSGKSASLDNIDASICFYDHYYHPQERFKINDGQWKAANFIFKNVTTESMGRPSTIARVNTCGGCTTYYIVGIWYWLDTGEIVDVEIISEYEVCSGGYIPFGYFGEEPEENPEPPPVEPCANANSLAQNAGFISKMQDLANALNQNHESAYLMKPGANNTTTYEYHNGGPSGANYNFNTNFFDGSTGFIHNHENNGQNLSIFSVHDFHAMSIAVAQANLPDPANFTFALVSPSGTSYILAINDLAKFQAFANNTFVGMNPTDFGAFSFVFNTYVNTNNTQATNEANFAWLLNTFGSNGGTGLTLLKGNAQLNQWQKVGGEINGTPTYTNCN